MTGFSLTRAVDRTAGETPHKDAVLADGVRLSWADFAARVARAAGLLQSLGLQAGDRAAILSLSSADYLTFYFAPIRAGGVMVPLNNRLSAQELAEIVKDCQPKILWVDAPHRALAEALKEQCPVLEHLVWLGPGDCPAGMIDLAAALAKAAPAPDAGKGDDDLACLFYTGGTTGRAKGAMLSHTNLMSNALHALGNLHFSRDTRHLHSGPLFHLAAGARVHTTTMVGGTHIVVPRFDVETVLDAIERDRPSHAVFVPTMVSRLLEEPGFGGRDLSSLRHLSYGAAPMAPALIRRWMQAMDWCSFTQSYGMTELSPVATSLLHADHQDDSKLASVGRPVFTGQVRVVDEADREVPRGTIGEICVAGPMVMQGYWNQPELSARTLRGGMMHTGDAGYMDEDGYVFLVDRLKDMIITGGENVYSVEVESVLYRHAAVVEAAVIGLPHPDWGEAVHAVVRLKDGALIDEAGLIAWCRASLAGYKCPKAITISTEPLPVSGVNKVLKSVLRERLSNRERIDPRSA